MNDPTAQSHNPFSKMKYTKRQQAMLDDVPEGWSQEDVEKRKQMLIAWFESLQYPVKPRETQGSSLWCVIDPAGQIMPTTMAHSDEVALRIYQHGRRSWPNKPVNEKAWKESHFDGYRIQRVRITVLKKTAFDCPVTLPWRKNLP